MTTYINVNKPSGTLYTNTNGQGREQYDQASVMYDDPNVFYDGTNPMMYTNVAKPIGTVYTDIAKPT